MPAKDPIDRYGPPELRYNTLENLYCVVAQLGDSGEAPAVYGNMPMISDLGKGPEMTRMLELTEDLARQFPERHLKLVRFVRAGVVKEF